MNRLPLYVAPLFRAVRLPSGTETAQLPWARAIWAQQLV